MTAFLFLLKLEFMKSSQLKSLFRKGRHGNPPGVAHLKGTCWVPLNHCFKNCFNKVKKMSPTRILQVILRQNPRCYDLRSSYHFQSAADSMAVFSHKLLTPLKYFQVPPFLQTSTRLSASSAGRSCGLFGRYLDAIEQFLDTFPTE